MAVHRRATDHAVRRRHVCRLVLGALTAANLVLGAAVLAGGPTSMDSTPTGGAAAALSDPGPAATGPVGVGLVVTDR